MDSTNRSELGGVDDAEKDLKPDNFDADNTNTNVSNDGTTLKISHDDTPQDATEPKAEPTRPDENTQPENASSESAPVPEPAPEPASEPTPNPVPTPEPAPTTPPQPAPQPGVPVNPFARPAPGAPAKPLIPQRPQFAAPQGDIILPNTQPQQKSKTPIIIIAITALIVIIIVIVGAVFLKQSPLAPKSTPQATFNQYANYLFNGNEDTSNPALPDDKVNNSNCYTSSLFASSDADTRSNHTTQLENLYNNFQNTAKSSNILPYTPSSDDNSGKPSVTDSDLQSISTTLQQLAIVAPIPFLSENTLIEKFSTNKSAASAFQYAQEYYARLSHDAAFTDNSSMIRHYYQLGVDTASLQLELIQIASDAGCIKNQKLDESCLSKSDQNARSQKLQQRISGLITYQETFINKYLDNILPINRNIQQIMRSA